MSGINLKTSLLCILLISATSAIAQVINVGNGSYTTTFPGTDAAGRNSYPSGTPFTTGIAATKPTPTNDWWSNKVKNNHSDNLFNYPFTLKTVNSGLVVTYIPWGVIDNIEPVVVGVAGVDDRLVHVHRPVSALLVVHEGMAAKVEIAGVGHELLCRTFAQFQCRECHVGFEGRARWVGAIDGTVDHRPVRVGVEHFPVIAADAV